MKKIVIYGQNYNEVVRLIEEINGCQKTYKIIGFLNDDKATWGNKVLGYKVLGGKELIPDLVKDGHCFFSNINSTIIDRKRVARFLGDAGCQVENLVSPEVDLNSVSIGVGCIVGQRSMIGAESKIGDYLTCRPGAIISHNTEVGDFIYVSPGAIICGYATIGDGSFIGAGAVILPRVKIGKRVVVGAGAVVNRDVKDKTVVVGNPAKVIKKDISDSYRGNGM